MNTALGKLSMFRNASSGKDSPQAGGASSPFSRMLLASRSVSSVAEETAEDVASQPQKLTDTQLQALLSEIAPSSTASPLKAKRATSRAAAALGIVLSPVATTADPGAKPWASPRKSIAAAADALLSPNRSSLALLGVDTSQPKLYSLNSAGASLSPSVKSPARAGTALRSFSPSSQGYDSGQDSTGHVSDGEADHAAGSGGVFLTSVDTGLARARRSLKALATGVIMECIYAHVILCHHAVLLNLNV